MVFYIRIILHDWPDKYCSKIFRNLISGLKGRSTIPVNENELPPVGAVNRALEKFGKYILAPLPLLRV